MEILTQDNHLMSDRYTLAKTQDIIDMIEPHGFVVDGVQKAYTKKKENEGFQKHLVTMKNLHYKTNEGVPTVLIKNSYNGSTGINIMTGYIRFACSNGLIIGSGIESLNMRHKQDWKQPIHQFLEEYGKRVEVLEQERNYLQMRRPSDISLRRFLQEAGKLRYSLNDIMDVNELNLIRRVEDRSIDMWTTYNRVQENLISGNFTRRIKHEGKENWSEARVLTNIDELTRVNKELYQLALETV